MRTKLGLISLLLTLCLILKAQDFKFSLQTGYGFYGMNTLKNVTKSVLGQLGFDAKLMSNYPPFLYYQPMIKYCSKNFEFGFLYTYQSTGSRISSRDYSGEYRFDTRIHSHSPALLLNTVLKDLEKYKLWWSLQLGGDLSTLKMSEFLQVSTTSSSSESVLSNVSFYFEPGITISVPLKQICLELHGGYHKEAFRNDFALNGSSGQGIRVNKHFMDSDIWDGFRLGLTISYRLFDNKDKKSNN